MLKQHKNSWFELIKVSGINIEDIQVTEPDELTFEIKIINTPLLFIIKQTPDNFDTFAINYTEYKPGFPLVVEKYLFESPTFSYPAHQTQINLRDWLRNIALRYIKEQQTIDLWSQSKMYSVFSSSSSIPKDELLPFTEEEKQSIKEGLKSFEAHLIETLNPLEEQLKTINERLGYLSNAVDRLNRFDWKAQALSTLTSIAINLGVDTETGTKLLTMFQQAMVHITKYLPPSIHLSH